MTRTPHHTGWAGALGVAAELSRRGYDATITLGNTPALDLLCSSPAGIPFKVQVKSLTKPNYVLIRHDMLLLPAQDSLYFAVVLVPSEVDKPFSYHLLTHADVCAHFADQRPVKKDGTPYKPGMDGLQWGQVKPHLDAWAILPE